MQAYVRGVPVCLVLLLAGCADIDLTKVEPEKTYRVGSNIAQRDQGLPSAVDTKTVNTADPDHYGLPRSVNLPPGVRAGH